MALALLSSYAAALAAWWTVAPQRSRLARGVSVAALLLAMAIFIVTILESDAAALARPGLRKSLWAQIPLLIAALTAGRMYSYGVESTPAPLGRYLRYISIGLLRPYLVYSPRAVRRSRPHLGREIARLLICVAIIPAAWIAAAMFIVRTPAVQDHWPLNHLAVLVGFVIIVTCAGQCLLAIWRLQGLPVRRPLVDNILAARTPADFWRRWSWPVHNWLFRYFYIPAGGRRHHVRAVMVAFLFSGLAHELLFFLALGRVTGHQTLFFLLNGVGVAASPQLERLARLGSLGRVLMRIVTLLFLILLSPIFFVSIHYVMPIYMKSIWLMW